MYNSDYPWYVASKLFPTFFSPFVVRPYDYSTLDHVSLFKLLLKHDLPKQDNTLRHMSMLLGLDFLSPAVKKIW